MKLRILYIWFWIGSLVMSSASPLLAQQEITFTHYMFSKMQFNPAFAAHTKALSVSGIHRSQWVGFEGAPITQSVAIQSPVFKKELGVGLSILNDKVGPVKTLSVYLDAAYKLKLGPKSNLAMGIKGGMSFMHFDLDQLKLENSGDLSFLEAAPNKNLPNVGFGFYYEQPAFYVGLGSPRLLESDLGANYGSLAKLRAQRHYFLNAGAKFKIAPKWEIKPYALIKAAVSAPVQFDVTAMFEYKEVVYFGPMFRYGDALGFLAGVYVNKQLRLGYSFDYSYGLNSAKYNGGSHEILIRYDFTYKDQGKIRSPRYF